MNNSMENMHTDVRVSRVDVRHEKMCPGSFLILGRSIVPFLVSLRGIKWKTPSSDTKMSE